MIYTLGIATSVVTMARLNNVVIARYRFAMIAEASGRIVVSVAWRSLRTRAQEDEHEVSSIVPY